eukprot:3936095-Rhodomonas_salina.3
MEVDLCSRGVGAINPCVRPQLLRKPRSQARRGRVPLYYTWTRNLAKSVYFRYKTYSATDSDRGTSHSIFAGACVRRSGLPHL